MVIVSPAASDANNGNARTAQRWAQLLGRAHRVTVVRQWPAPGSENAQVMLALHARRSAEAIAAWHARHGERGLAVVLTGTDLYRDIATDASARASLTFASRLVVLQERGADALPAALRPRARVIFQSTPALPPARKPQDALLAVVVGHLRPEKSPETVFQAARLLAARGDIRIEHLGAADSDAWQDAIRAAQAQAPGYRWLGPRPHEETRERIRQAHLLVHPSAMEGGAHVVMEAVRSGTPVLASRVPGNVGMLGDDYAGYFPPGDAPALAALLAACRDTQGQADGRLATLSAQCEARAPLFDPETERQGLMRLVDELSTP